MRVGRASALRYHNGALFDMMFFAVMPLNADYFRRCRLPHCLSRLPSTQRHVHNALHAIIVACRAYAAARFSPPLPLDAATPRTAMFTRAMRCRRHFRERVTAVREGNKGRR